MAQCEGKTKKGDRCKREASEGSFCSIHQDQAIRERHIPEGAWDKDAIMKAALGFALIGALVLFRFRR